MYEMSPEERAKLGAAGREHVLKNYNFETFTNGWIKTIDETIEKHGSWETRKNYNTYNFTEL